MVILCGTWNEVVTSLVAWELCCSCCGIPLSVEELLCLLSRSVVVPPKINVSTPGRRGESGPPL
jgi:hypothetical protein